MIFVAATDTGSGKTVVAGLLGRYLAEEGYSVVTQKWAGHGNSGFSKDIRLHLRLMGKKKGEFGRNISLMAPYTFKYASSPHLAACLEGKRVSVSKIGKSLAGLLRDFDIVVVEGTGGLLVPLNGKWLLIDVIKKFRLPVLLVAENRIGAINHTLLSVEALRSRDIKIIGIIFNNPLKGTSGTILKDNVQTVKTLTGIRIIGALPYVRDSGLLRKHFTPLGKRIAARL